MVSSSKSTPPTALLLAAVAAVILRLVFLGWTGVMYEDALISLRYAENLAHGRGLVYNPGEWVFGASTPLYVLWLAFLSWTGVPWPLQAAQVVAAVADGCVLFFWARFLLERTGSRAAPGLFAVLFGLSPWLVQNSVSGMETSYALLWLTGAFLQDARGRPWLTGLFLGLLVLTRPDAAIFAMLLLGLRLWRDRQLPWRQALTMIVIAVPWLVYAQWAYGSVVPHSVTAKAAAYNLHIRDYTRSWNLTLGLVAPSLGGPNLAGVSQRLVSLCLLPLCLFGAVAALRRWPSLAVVPLFLGAWCAYLVLPRTFIFPWYLPPMALAAYAVAACGYAWLERTVSARAWTVLRALPAVMGVLFLPWLLVNAQGAEMGRNDWNRVREEIGMWLREHTAPDARVAMEPIGYIGYFSRRHVLDEVGLVSPQYVPLNRAGDGWFIDSLQRFRPEYVVERPHYLRNNSTLNSGVRMFRSPGDWEWFRRHYVPVYEDQPTRGRPQLRLNYSFIVYERADLRRNPPLDRAGTGR